MTALVPISAALSPNPAHGPSANAGAWSGVLGAAHGHAPYLARLMQRRVDLLDNCDADWPRRLVREAMACAHAVVYAQAQFNDQMRALRRAKDALHLGLAIGDLARVMDLEEVTGALTDFADAALNAALRLAVGEAQKRGDLRGDLDGACPGLALIAMGKMGAHELNYSSDIDFSVFFDADGLALGDNREARPAAVRLVASIVRALEEITADGYVFRTDLRLRPDPSSTPVAVSIASAEHYYQTLGQNWERAAFIKARPAAGDLALGREFLAALQVFVWRRHLDFAALADVYSIKRQILSTHGGSELGEAAFDVKLGRGGIRDIELFVQTQQLILGGRNVNLRNPRTRAALSALADAGAVDRSVREALDEAYVFYREVEHRVQMLEDAHTHTVPGDIEARARLAALCGFAEVSAFDAQLIERRRLVADIDHALFGRKQSLAAPEGSLIFTGVDDHPETLETIGKLGFRDAAFVSQTIRGWHHGRIRAMRSERAREILTRLTPRLLRAFGSEGEPDEAFKRFAAFFAGLSAGVQVLSLLEARPALLERLARLLSISPLLAATLARRPGLLDALIDHSFNQYVIEDVPGARVAGLAARLEDLSSFEDKLNAARRFQREEAFRISVQTLTGEASASAAGAARADLAEACVDAMAQVALGEAERLYGPQPGAFVIMALGKFGGRELAEGSDVDVMLVYDAPAEAAAAGEFYIKLSQRLISALSAQTEEGSMYEVDMQLRPSGSKGPVAVRLSSFERYYAEDAWTWEFLALTRARIVAGDGELGARVQGAAHAALARPRERDKVLREVADMRARMERDRRAASVWDLKLAPGGFVDVEFIVQALQIVSAEKRPDVISPNTGEALWALRSADVISHDRAQTLLAAWRLYSDLQQVLRVCGEGDFEPRQATDSLKRLLCDVGEAADFAELEMKLKETQAHVRALFAEIVGPVG